LWNDFAILRASGGAPRENAPERMLFSSRSFLEWAVRQDPALCASPPFGTRQTERRSARACSGRRRPGGNRPAANASTKAAPAMAPVAAADTPSTSGASCATLASVALAIWARGTGESPSSREAEAPRVEEKSPSLRL